MPKAQELRKSRRRYDLLPTVVRLKNHDYRVNDISSEGIGIVLDPDSPRFAIGERLNAIPLPLREGSVAVRGVVSHISVCAAGTLCGIRFEVDSEQFALIARFKKERVRPPA